MGSIDVFTIIQIIGLILLLIIGLELILRNKGIKPKTVTKEKSEIIPKGKLYEAHPRLGFIFKPGSFQININDRFEFSANHNEDGHRITSANRDNGNHSDKPEMWIFGCSFTYGWLVEDEETFPWLIQEQLKDWQVTNFGVSGYSILQSYLQFKETIKEDAPPQIVILAYGSEIHDKRNTLARKRKKSFTRLERTSPFLIPCGCINKNGEFKIKYKSTKYIGFPFSSYSALMSRLEYSFDTRYDNRLNSKEVAKRILLEFNRLCDKVDSIFIVAGIHEGKATRKMLNYCDKQGMKTLNMSIDRGKNHPEHSFYPHDDHPSPLAHKKYADKILQYLERNSLANIRSSKYSNIKTDRL